MSNDRPGEDVVVTDAEGKNGGGDDEDVTRPASEPSAPGGPTVAGDANAPAATEDATDFGPRRGPAVLKRVAPEESAGDTILLSGDDYLLGRSHTCTVRLHSATASRQHAKIEGRSDEWFLSPVGSRPLIIDGHPAYGEVRLRDGMKVQLGGDEFVFVQEDSSPEELEGQEGEEETLVTPSSPAGQRPVPAPETGGRPVAWIAVIAAAVLLAALAFWLLL